MTTALLFDLRRFSIHDGPGIRTTLFFKGCPLSCLWCHNPESQKVGRELLYHANRCTGCGECLGACPEGALSASENGEIQVDLGLCRVCGDCAAACAAEARQLAGRQWTVAEMMAEIERDRPFYERSGGGVTLSGGEPLLQAEAAGELLRACRQAEIHTALDTSGYASWPVLERLLPDVNLFLYDLKLVDEAEHRGLTGVSSRVVIENLRHLSQRGCKIRLRIPLIPGLNDQPASLHAAAALAASLPSLEGVDLLPYHAAGAGKYARVGKAYSLIALRAPSPAELREIAGFFEAYGLTVRTGG